jgi:hypothetical protein
MKNWKSSFLTTRLNLKKNLFTKNQKKDPLTLTKCLEFLQFMALTICNIKGFGAGIAVHDMQNSFQIVLGVKKSFASIIANFGRRAS